MEARLSTHNVGFSSNLIELLLHCYLALLLADIPLNVYIRGWLGLLIKSKRFGTSKTNFDFNTNQNYQNTLVTFSKTMHLFSWTCWLFLKLKVLPNIYHSVCWHTLKWMCCGRVNIFYAIPKKIALLGINWFYVSYLFISL